MTLGEMALGEMTISRGEPAWTFILTNDVDYWFFVEHCSK